MNRNNPPAYRGNQILTDAGPLIAWVNETNQRHSETMDALERIPQGTTLLTTYLCLTETFLRVANRRHIHRQNHIITEYQQGTIALHHPGEDEFQRILALMEQFQDRPMSIADASLVAASETLDLKVVFTCDSDFRFYTNRNNSVLMMYPQDYERTP